MAKPTCPVDITVPALGSHLAGELGASAVPIDALRAFTGPAADTAFVTDRLSVYRSTIRLPDGLGAAVRLLFVAFGRVSLTDAPKPVATALIGFYPKGSGEIWTPHCDWIEVAEDSRRQGFGTELFDGVERHTGWTIYADTWPEFLRALTKARQERLSVRPTEHVVRAAKRQETASPAAPAAKRGAAKGEKTRPRRR